MNWNQVLLYRTEAEVPQDLRRTREVPTPLASRLLFDGRLWETSVEAATVILRPEIGAEFRLPPEHFQRLIASGEMKEVTDASPSPLADSAREIVSHAGPKALDAANRRLREILAYRNGEAITVTARSIQNWLAAFRRAEAEYATAVKRIGMRDYLYHTQAGSSGVDGVGTHSA
jgi:hypothetical protein